MNRFLIGFMMDMSMLALMWYGLFYGNQYASNLFFPIVWVFIVLAIFVVIIFNNEESKEKVKADRKPRSEWMVKYSFGYDAVFAACLAVSGFQWTAAIWWFVMLIAMGSVESLDKEIREESK